METIITALWTIDIMIVITCGVEFLDYCQDGMEGRV